MRSGRSCSRWIVVGGHSVAVWRSVCCCRLTMVGVRRVLSVLNLEPRQIDGIFFESINCVCEYTEAS